MEVNYTCTLEVYSTNDFYLFKVDWTDTQIPKSTIPQCKAREANYIQTLANINKLT